MIHISIPNKSRSFTTGNTTVCDSSCPTCLYVGLEVFDNLSEASRVQDKAEGKRVLVIESPGPRANDSSVHGVFLVLDKVQGPRKTISGSRWREIRGTYSCPQTSLSASNSSLMDTVNPGRLTTRVWLLKFLVSTLLARTKFSMTLSGEATHASSSSNAGSSKESPIGQMASTP